MVGLGGCVDNPRSRNQHGGVVHIAAEPFGDSLLGWKPAPVVKTPLAAASPKDRDGQQSLQL